MKKEQRTLTWTNDGVSKLVEELTKEELIQAIYELYDDAEKAFEENEYYKRMAVDVLHSQRHMKE
tara:strand:- start:431 stop:625 length:195 start_codon:yes stop_codon:yes gene_type:complete